VNFGETLKLSEQDLPHALAFSGVPPSERKISTKNTYRYYVSPENPCQRVLIEAAIHYSRWKIPSALRDIVTSDGWKAEQGD